MTIPPNSVPDTRAATPSNITREARGTTAMFAKTATSEMRCSCSDRIGKVAAQQIMHRLRASHARCVAFRQNL